MNMIRVFGVIGFLIGWPGAVMLLTTPTVDELGKRLFLIFQPICTPLCFAISQNIGAGLYYMIIIANFGYFLALGLLFPVDYRRGREVVLGRKEALAYDFFVIITSVAINYVFSDDKLLVIYCLAIVNHVLCQGVVVFQWVGLGLLDLIGCASFTIVWYFASGCSSLPLKISLLIFSVVVSFQRRLPIPTAEQLLTRKREDDKAPKKLAEEDQEKKTTTRKQQQAEDGITNTKDGEGVKNMTDDGTTNNTKDEDEISADSEAGKAAKKLTEMAVNHEDVTSKKPKTITEWNPESIKMEEEEVNDCLLLEEGAYECKESDACNYGG